MAKRTLPLFVAFVMLLMLAQGCAPSRKYAWGGYAADLYSHYKNPQDMEAHLERLQEYVNNAEAEDRVPPGLYAEYGYCLYELGNIDEAVLYFEKEKAKWPESNVLMEKMIRNARRQQENLRRPSSMDSSQEQEETK
jgi:hypothetical protein